MSTNEKIRKLTDRLPAVPKLHNGELQYDGYGSLVMLNHFREIKEIYETYKNNIPERNRQCEIYVQSCYAFQDYQETMAKKRRIEAFTLLLAEILLVLLITACIVKALWHHLY